MSTFRGYPTAPEYYPNDIEHRRKLASSINQAISGKINAVNELTLAAGVSTTELVDNRLSVNSFIGFLPKTANAATELSSGTMFVDDATRTNGVAVISHANNAQTDRIFQVLIIG